MKFMDWLAVSPVAGVLKIAAAAALGAVGSYVATAEVDPLVVGICAAVIPILVNALNGQDPRYGVKDPALFEGED